MTEFDLGAARRSRTREDDKNLVVSGTDGEVEAKYRLVAELPVEFLDSGAKGEFLAAFRSLFVDDSEATEFLDTYRPSLADLGEIVSGLYPGIGGDLGEALASGVSSMTSTKR